MLHLNDVDHDAAPVTKGHAHLAEDATGRLGGKEQLCCAYFPQVSLDAGGQTLSFSLRDDNLEPSSHESQTCYLDLQQDHLGEGIQFVSGLGVWIPRLHGLRAKLRPRSSRIRVFAHRYI